MARTRLVDLGHVIRAGMTTYPGLPGPTITDHLSREASRQHYAPGTEFQIGRLEMVANTGTYVDSPFHRYEDGADLAGLALEVLADLDAVCIHVPDHVERAIGPGALAGRELRGRAVLIHTGWARHWETNEYFSGHPFLTSAAAEHLIAAGAVFVGIDSLNIDDTTGGTRPVHSALLAAGIPVCEHMTGLEQLPDRGFRFSAVPPMISRFGTFPVRAWARIEV